MRSPMLRDYRADDAEAIVRVALAAFAQFEQHYSDWPLFTTHVAKMPELAKTGEIIVAEDGGRIVGAVAYVGPQAPKPAFFDPAWPVVRMLVVDPEARGKGIGRQLTEECLRRAERDQAGVIALHTTPIMTVALPMYLRMGFARVGEAPDILGVPYAVYVKRLG
ncbi:GNAT family N-acetyltransferase [Bradyrhizobium commune]|nr:GNAT family N-acetyltransferase [Bradyrhizobium commune]